MAYIAYGDFKDLVKKTASDKVLRRKEFNIAKNKKNIIDTSVVFFQCFTIFLIKSL